MDKTAHIQTMTEQNENQTSDNHAEPKKITYSNPQIEHAKGIAMSNAGTIFKNIAALLQKMDMAREDQFYTLCPQEWGISYARFQERRKTVHELIPLLQSVSTTKKNTSKIQAKKAQIQTILTQDIDFVGLYQIFFVEEKPHAVPPANISKKTVTQPSSKAERTEKGKPSSLFVDDLTENEILKLSKSVTDFSRDATTIRIYIDEAWPETRQSGVISGVVWCGKDVDNALLPHIPTHRRTPSTFLTSVQNLLSCTNAFPFIFPIFYSKKVTESLYPEMIRIALATLLGWILPQEGKKCDVHVFLEGILAAHMPAEQNVASIFQEMRNSIVLTTGRMQRWNIREVYSMSTEKKSFEYIPYADLVSYFTLAETNEKAEQFESRFQVFRSWPGYVPISIDLLRMLNDLDTGSAAGYAETLLDFAKDHSGTKLYCYVIRQAIERAKKDPELLRAIFEQLEKMYEAKDRDLKQLDAVVIPFTQEFPLEMLEPYPKQKLVRILVELQQANHNGDPLKVQRCAELYEKEREKLVKQGQDLCAYADMNLAVHYNDRMEFEKAAEICRRWEGNPAFDFLTPENQGRILSSIGQSYAFREEYRKADEYFEKAIRIFQDKENPLPGQADHTMVYRALNALDAGGYPVARQLAEQVFGCPFVEAIKKYAGTLENPFHHHLLVKNLFFNPEVVSMQKEYLDCREKWQEMDQHPWELILLYRGLMLAKTDPDAAKQVFSRLWEFYAPEKGAIMHLLEAFARATYDCTFKTDENKAYILSLCNSVHTSLPAAKKYCQAILDNMGSFEKISGVIPFNYK